MKFLKKALITLIIFLIINSAFSAPEVIMLKFKIDNNTLKTKFRLKSVANSELIELIINSGQRVEIEYRIKIFEKRGFLRSDKKVLKDYVLYSYITYNSFSRVFTLKFLDENNKATIKRFPRYVSNIKTIRMIVKKFFNKSRGVNINIAPLNRKENEYLFKFRIYIRSVRLTPPYDIVNSSFNFRVDKDITF